ncbi:MAG: hypothetical protein ACYC7J_04730 [Syntrophales bacterium]
MSMVGKNIDAFCSRCGFTLAHIVLYEVGGTVQGVQCKTCGAQHRYRGARTGGSRDIAAERRRSREAPRQRPPVRPADSRVWEQRSAAALPDAVVWDYQLTEPYEKGDVISHPQFGRGFVEAVTTDRMEVLFREGRKALAMNRRPASGEPG